MEKPLLRSPHLGLKRSVKLMMVILGLCAMTNAQAGSPIGEQNLTGQQQNQGKVVSGQVSDANGEALFGVAVAIEGTSKGLITDFDGKFSIEVPSENSVLIFSFVGYMTQKITVADQTQLTVVMPENVQQVDEVVVTAMGVKRQSRELGYAMSTISAKQLSEGGSTSFATALYGKAAGVKITTAPGGATSASNVQIRGINSLNYNQQPLYVVDGVVIRNDAQYGAAGANNNNYWDDQRIRGNGALDINPNDIESLNILKGASATALYGSDAASGVIVITTKKGTKKKGMGVDLTYNLSVEEVAYLPKFQNTYGPGYDRANNIALGATAEGWVEDADSPSGVRPYFRAYGSFGPKMDGRQVTWWDGSTRSYSAQEDNYKDIYRTGVTSNLNLALSDNSERLNYRFTASRMDYQGTQEGSEQQKTNLGLTSSLKLADNLSVDVYANYVNTITTNRPYQLGQVLGSFSGFFSRTEDMSVMKQRFQTEEGYKYATFGSERTDDAFKYSIRATNLLDFFWNQMKNKYVETENRLISSGTLNWDIAKDLHFRGRVGSDFTSIGTDQKSYTEYPTAYNSSSSSSGGYSVASGNYSILYTDALLSYNKSFDDKFAFTVSGGFQSRDESYKDQSSATKNGLVTENWFSLSNSYGVATTSYTRKEMLKYAYLGMLSMSYKNFLFLEGTARQEYASTLPSANNSYFYPSVNGSVIFSDVLNLPEFFNYGKFRASYGIVGNAPPMYESNISYTQSSLQTINGSVPQLSLSSNYGNANLKAEKKKEYEFGLETQFLENRIGLDVSYYNNVIEDQILNLSTAASVGASSQLVNVGEIGNSGFELGLNTTPILKNGFRWDARFNFSINKSKVNSLANGIDELVFYTAEQSAIKLVAGEGDRLGDIYVYERAQDSDGNYLISDDGLYIIDKTKYVKAGNIMPKVVGGLSNSFSYKGFNLDLAIDYRIGGKMISPSMKYMRGAGLLENSMDYRDAEHGGLSYVEDGVTYNDGVLLDGVSQSTGEKNTTVVEAAYYYMNTYDWGSSAWNSDGAIFDNSYIKMREIVLGYKIPTSISEKLHLNNLRVSLVGRNLFYIWRTLENLDPEAPLGTKWWSQGIDVGSTAASRSYGITLNASF
ncbi:SusC/RagA family TonB-linked outer membrane protein [Mangrovibacterium lignilyticum]|uniref:SusC/RagA family TonB-linked outer membrane protein n=1 Tax=Mangrovibacterium lignilyticum TaxID=2668052 RepID=UPI0013D68C86|nr:SusC/RagA family TonB-linked outer membrane protein [Mangrovibacterium lignilyticum]